MTTSGDKLFDGVFAQRGPFAMRLAVLTEEARSSLLELAAVGRSVEVAGGRISVDLDDRMPWEDVERVTVLLTEVKRRLACGPAEIPGRLADLARHVWEPAQRRVALRVLCRSYPESSATHKLTGELFAGSNLDLALAAAGWLGRDDEIERLKAVLRGSTGALSLHGNPGDAAGGLAFVEGFGELSFTEDGEPNESHRPWAPLNGAVEALAAVDFLDWPWTSPAH
jgi:hypothetical protein